MKMGYSNSMSTGRRKKPLVWTMVNQNTDFSSYTESSSIASIASGWGDFRTVTTWTGSYAQIASDPAKLTNQHYAWNNGSSIIPGGFLLRAVTNMYRAGGSNITYARGPIKNRTSFTDNSCGCHAMTGSPQNYTSYDVLESNNWPGFLWCKNQNCGDGESYDTSDLLRIGSYEVYKITPDHYTTNYFAYNFSAGGDMISASLYYDAYLESDYQPEIGAHYRIKFFHTLDYGEEFSVSMGGWNSGAITNHVATHYTHEFTATATDKFRITAAQGNTVKIGYIEIEKGE